MTVIGQPRECAGRGQSAIQTKFVNSILFSPASDPSVTGRGVVRALSPGASAGLRLQALHLEPVAVPIRHFG